MDRASSPGLDYNMRTLVVCVCNVVGISERRRKSVKRFLRLQIDTNKWGMTQKRYAILKIKQIIESYYRISMFEACMWDNVRPLKKLSRRCNLTAALRYEMVFHSLVKLLQNGAFWCFVKYTNKSFKKMFLFHAGRFFQYFRNPSIRQQLLSKFGHGIRNEFFYGNIYHAFINKIIFMVFS